MSDAAIPRMTSNCISSTPAMRRTRAFAASHAADRTVKLCQSSLQIRRQLGNPHDRSLFLERRQFRAGVREVLNAVFAIFTWMVSRSAPAAVNDAMAKMNIGSLSGVRVLIVEDDPLLLMDLESTLMDAGAAVAGLCQTLDEALSRLEVNDFSVAVLDFRLGSETVSPVARKLANQDVPFVLYTGQVSADERLAGWRRCAVVEKPAPPPARSHLGCYTGAGELKG